MRPEWSSALPQLRSLPCGAAAIGQFSLFPGKNQQRPSLLLPVLRALAFQHYKNMQGIKE